MVLSAMPPILEAFYFKLENLRFSGEKRGKIPPVESYLRSYSSSEKAARRARPSRFSQASLAGREPRPPS